jgi:Tfp pilus assembly protein PilV
MRSAFTLVETLVALVLLEAGMLALAASSAVAARDLAIAHRGLRAQSLARNRVERLWATACSSPASGEAVAAGFVERWTVEIVEDRRMIAVIVEFALPRGRTRSISLTAATICRR